MAADSAETAERLPCPPCRGTGSVISNLGGSAQTLECPWCDGSGFLMEAHDAQARHRKTDQTATPEGADSAE